MRHIINIQGLVSKNSNKLQSKELQDIFKGNDIVLMTETWLSDEACVEVNGVQTFKLRMFAAKEKVFKLFFQPLFFDSKIQHKPFDNKINIG